MLKYQGAITTGLATMLLAGSYLGQDERSSLQSALTRTVRALEELAGVRGELAARSDHAYELMVQHTEAPIANERDRDTHLSRLREEIGQLHQELDQRSSAAAHMDLTPTPRGVGRHASGAAPHSPSPRDPNKPPSGERLAPRSSAGTLAEEPHQGSLPAYSADRLAQAKACYRAGLFERGLRILEGREPDARGLYWTARIHEKLGRIDRAIEAMKGAADLKEDSYEGQRAASDLEFLEWKKGFLENLPREGARSE